MVHLQLRISLLLLIVGLTIRPAIATTYYVGTCKTGAFNTISAAVGTVPAGSIINVCPGSYSEQVIISQPLTLQGISRNNSSQAVISIPASGLMTVPSIMNFGSLAPQVEVTVGPVTITNITVDGTADSTTCPVGNYVGILYTSGSSGTVNRVATRNQNCNSNGWGIVAENGSSATRTVTIQNSDVESNTFAGITVCGLPANMLGATVKNNYVSNDNMYGVFST